MVGRGDTHSHRVCVVVRWVMGKEVTLLCTYMCMHGRQKVSQFDELEVQYNE